MKNIDWLEVAKKVIIAAISAIAGAMTQACTGFPL